jgi:hypothetical protein
MHRRASSRGVPLPGNDPRGLGRSEPSLGFPPAGAHGVRPFAGLIPQPGGPAFLPARAHLPFVPFRPTRLIFVELDPAAFVLRK